MFGYRETDSAELKELKRRWERARWKVECLRANLKRINYEEFGPLADELERAQAEVCELGRRVHKKEFDKYSRDLPGR